MDFRETAVSRKILVVEDEAIFRTALKERLSDDGYSVETAENGEVAALKVQELSPSIVISDLMMPKVDGLSLLKISKAIFPIVEFIFITGKGGVNEAVEAMKSGAFDFLVKPVYYDKLKPVIEKCFAKVDSRRSSSAPNMEGLADEILSACDATKQESEIARLISNGVSHEQIAAHLHISYHTVKKHANNLYRKLDVKGREELIFKLKRITSSAKQIPRMT